MRHTAEHVADRGTGKQMPKINSSCAGLARVSTSFLRPRERVDARIKSGQSVFDILLPYWAAGK
jgi:hypothetical protein